MSGNTSAMTLDTSTFPIASRHGIMQLAVADLLAAAETNDQGLRVIMSAVEVYRNDVHDIMDQVLRARQVRPTDRAYARKFGRTTLGATDCVAFELDTADTAQQLLRDCVRLRRAAPTEHNTVSSRSHFVVRLVVESSRSARSRSNSNASSRAGSRSNSPVADEGSSAVTSPQAAHGRPSDASTEVGDAGTARWSCLDLVDLAGSETTAATADSRVQFQEGVATNTDLHHLGTMVRQRAAGMPFVSYRNCNVRSTV